MRQRNLSQQEKKTHSLQVATWIQPFLLLFVPFFCHRSAAYQAEILGAASGAGMADIKQNEE